MQVHDSVRDNVTEREDDLLWVGPQVTYSSILIKVFVMLEHAAQIGARWLLKTDDDAYVNVPQAVQVRQPSVLVLIGDPLAVFIREQCLS